MSFLAPLFLLGALAIGLPILFHLIRRTPTIQQRFSSLMFLAPSPPQLSRRSRLDKILLLILRCIIICLLAFAFARPFFRSKTPVDPGTGPVRAVVLLVDASASMRRGNLWNDAVAKARDLLQRAGPADQYELAVFDRGVRKLQSFEDWSALAPQERIGAAAARLAGLSPSWAATDLGSALTFAAEELDSIRSLQPSATRQIIVVTDLQEGSRIQNLQGYEWPKGIAVLVERVQAKSANAGLHLAVEGEGVVNDDRPLVRINNAPDSRREQFRLAWADPKTGAALSGGLEVHVAAGKSRVLRAPKRPANLLANQLILTGDDDAFDNKLFVGSAEPERVVVSYAGSAKTNDSADLLFYLQRAFQETLRRSVQIQPLQSTGAVPADVKFLIAEDRLSEAHGRFARSFLDNGGTVLLTMKTPDAARTIELLTGLTSVQAREASVRQYALLEQIDFEHPLFSLFADPRYSDFTKIHFWKHRHLDTNTVPGARIIARFDDGAPALLELPAGKGTLLVLTSGWQPADSQLALSSKFVPLLYAMLENAGAFNERSSRYFVGDELPSGRDASARPEGPSVIKPDGTEIPPDARKVFDTPGVYAVRERAMTYRVAVNLDPAESRTAPLNLDELERLAVPVREQTPAAVAKVERERRSAQAAELEGRQKLWRWVIIAALAFLFIEIWFAARLSRPQPMEA